MDKIPQMLIVDDAHAIRAILAICCRHAGYEPVSVENANQALAVARTQSFHLILANHWNAKLDSVSFCRQLRLTKGHEKTSVAICSNSLDTLDIAGLQRELDPLFFIPKPVDIESYPDLIRAAARVPADCVE